MLRTRIATTLAEVDELEPVWDQLYQPEYQTIFQQFVPNRTAIAHFAGRASPYVVLCESDSSAALIPASIDRHSGTISMLGERLFDYRDTLSAGSGEALEQAWGVLAALGRPLSVVAVRPEARPRWSALPCSDFANAPGVVRSDADADTFRATHNRLGMLFRRLVKRGVFLRQSNGTNSPLVRTIYELKAARFGHDPHNIFLDPARREFMVACCAALGDACQVFTLQHDATRELVAALITFREERARRFYTVYFDPQWAKFSPGVVLVYEVTARTLAEDLDCDYMTGEYPYKNRLATNLCPLLRIEATTAELRRAAGDRVSEAA